MIPPHPGLVQALCLKALAVYRESLSRHALLTVFAALMLAMALPTAMLLALDDRTWRDVAIWAKPLKFMLSTVAFAATTAWFVGLLPKSRQASPMVHGLAWTLVITASFKSATSACNPRWEMGLTTTSKTPCMRRCSA